MVRSPGSIFEAALHDKTPYREIPTVALLPRNDLVGDITLVREMIVYLSFGL